MKKIPKIRVKTVLRGIGITDIDNDYLEHVISKLDASDIDTEDCYSKSEKDAAIEEAILEQLMEFVENGRLYI